MFFPFQTAARYWHTLRYLRPVQIYGRLWHRLSRPKVDNRPAPDGRNPHRRWLPPAARPATMQGPDQFRFLNHDGRIETAAGWNAPNQTKLWLYHLHYFDDLNALDAEKRGDWHRALTDRWITENPPPAGNGWEPYPLSLRIVNWIKWALAGNELTPEWRQSLAVQVRFLTRRLEWHLLGNHLFANAKALVFAGLFFRGREADAWLEKGLSILAREAPEQILDDGGHFERSPMYHAIVLEDVLDLVNAARAYGLDEDPSLAQLPEIVTKMLTWLAAMTHPDGQISFFNDGAFGMASAPDDIATYAGRLDFAPVPKRRTGYRYLDATGYVRIDHEDATAILDVAPVGPDYLPGHAHADTLSFELSVGCDRVVVNGGTSVYGTSAQRHFERSTAAHSTVEIDGQDSSEVWGGFRVARRARPHNIEINADDETVSVSAEHDGYRRFGGNVVHKRRWRMEKRRLVISESITGSCRDAIARFHLGQGVEPSIADDGRAGEIVLPQGRSIRWQSSVPARIEPSQWHPEFGKTVKTKSLVVDITGSHLETAFLW